MNTELLEVLDRITDTPKVRRKRISSFKGTQHPMSLASGALLSVLSRWICMVHFILLIRINITFSMQSSSSVFK